MSGFDPFVGRTEPSDGEVVETARVPLWCHDTGGEGEPLVLLGGFTAGHFGFDFVRPYLGGAGRRNGFRCSRNRSSRPRSLH